MREITIGKNDAGQRADTFLAKALPLLPPSLRQKYLRLKRIKRGGVRLRPEDRLTEGDVLSLYIGDEFFAKPQGDDAWRRIRPNLTVAYEDENILVADKRAGMLVHSDDSGDENTLINHIKAYLYAKGEWNPVDEQSFTPALANRIDRNTCGLVLAAKNAAALRVLNEKIKSREIKKYYYAVVHGVMKPENGRLDGYIERDLQNKTVRVVNSRAGDAKTAATVYRTIAKRSGLSLLECELLTGRTHQIRAQFAAAGHPLLGDGKYGTNEQNKKYGRKTQALQSYRVVFEFGDDAGALGYLKGKSVTAEKAEFVREFLGS
jgi:23S rRNA pseudouridine955/2504/2580 synthase